MFRLHALLAPLAFAGVLGAASDSLASVDEYLQLDVPATATATSTKVDMSHQGWLTIKTFAWKDPTNVPVIRSPDPTHPNHSAVVITRERDASSTKILDLVRTHKVLDKVTIDERKVSGPTQDLYRILLAQVTVTDYSVADGPHPTETFILHFAKVEVQHYPVNGQNAGNADTQFQDSWDTQT